MRHLLVVLLSMGAGVFTGATAVADTTDATDRAPVAEKQVRPDPCADYGSKKKPAQKERGAAPAKPAGSTGKPR